MAAATGGRGRSTALSFESFFESLQARFRELFIALQSIGVLGGGTFQRFFSGGDLPFQGLNAFVEASDLGIVALFGTLGKKQTSG